MAAKIHLDRERIAAFCRQHGIRKLSLFGSVLRDDFRPDSDVDVLVEFEPELPITLFDVVRMEHALSELVGRQVDLRTPQDLSRYFRDEVIAEAEVQFAKAG